MKTALTKEERNTLRRVQTHLSNTNRSTRLRFVTLVRSSRFPERCMLHTVASSRRFMTIADLADAVCAHPFA